MANNVIRSERSISVERLIHTHRDGLGDWSGTALESIRCYLLRIAASELGRDLRRKADPSDIVQETLLKAHRDFLTFQGQTVEEFRAWLRGIMWHCILEQRRRFECSGRDVMREATLQEDCFEVDHLDHLPSDHVRPLTEAIRSERALILERALRRLSERDRLLVTWRHTENCTFKEMGKRLGCSLVAARKAWLLAVERLRKELHSLRKDSSFGGTSDGCR